MHAANSFHLLFKALSPTSFNRRPQKFPRWCGNRDFTMSICCGCPLQISIPAVDPNSTVCTVSPKETISVHWYLIAFVGWTGTVEARPSHGALTRYSPTFYLNLNVKQIVPGAQQVSDQPSSPRQTPYVITPFIAVVRGSVRVTTPPRRWDRVRVSDSFHKVPARFCFLAAKMECYPVTFMSGFDLLPAQL